MSNSPFADVGQCMYCGKSINTDSDDFEGSVTGELIRPTAGSMSANRLRPLDGTKGNFNVNKFDSRYGYVTGYTDP